MEIPERVGFAAVLSAYSGRLETDFQFPNVPLRRTTQRIIGKYGDGSARVELDSFSGGVSLRKIDEGSVTGCQR